MSPSEPRQRGHTPVAQAPLPGSDEAIPSTARAAEATEAADLALFHIELRRRNIPILLWSTTLFDTAYVAWTVLDRALAPDQWHYFLAIRLTVAALGTIAAALIAWGPRQDRSPEVFAVWLTACGFGIALMLPAVQDNFLAYSLGFSLIVYGAGLLPFWSPSWAAATVAAVVLSPLPVFALRPPLASRADLITATFFVLTGALASVAMATFKYSLTRADFQSRQAHLRTAEKLEAALEQIQDLDQRKNRLFSNISHEIRSPLTLIMAPVQDLLAHTPGGPARRKLQAVEQNAERLLRLIDDLLDLSKLDAGHLRLHLTTFDLGALVDAHAERSRPAAELRGLRLQIEVPTALPPVLGDEHRIEIVLSNLLGNAMKYTPRGGWIALRIVRADDALRVDVQDDGPGISKDQLERVFDRFFQAADSQSRSVGGVGIGLALAHELVELHGGTLSVHSRPGQGSTFSFTLPLGTGHIRPEVIDRRGGLLGGKTDPRTGPKDAAHPRRRSSDLPRSQRHLPDALPADASGVQDASPDALQTTPAPLVLERGRRARILVADDQDDIREYIVGLLSEHYQVLEATDGAQAWAIIRAERPDLVLSDIMMPIRSGSALCEDIKRDPALRHIPVILLTALASSTATLEAYAVGADDFIAKPFHPRILLARVSAQLRLRAMSAQLAKREGLAAVGTLAAGILHEVRNPVNALMSARQTLALPDLDDQTRDELLDVMADATQRIHDLTSTLDAHIRPAENGGPLFCVVREGMESSLRLLGHRMHHISVHQDYQINGSAAAPPGPLNQVLVNLLDNAIKAGASNLWICIEGDGATVRVTVADDGKGMSEHTLEHIFEPFFTTAVAGKGTGLGLYVSQSIVERAGGTLTAAQQPGGGARFTIDLPAAKQD